MSDPGERDAVWREEGVLRPLQLQSTGAKLMQHALHAPVAHHAAWHVHHRGFVRGRNLLANVLEVDSDFLIQDLRGDEQRLPALVCFDFVAAHGPWWKLGGRSGSSC